ncbi:unnamed protein product [Adineta ricciae]|uniref:Uncharacterized protein n=1 Tax=Adineta ricciae TaxID=249248 RepID=A0A814T842_ADIRI|nr:unnamed protein product [Adineta ricciae]
MDLSFTIERNSTEQKPADSKEKYHTVDYEEDDIQDQRQPMPIKQSSSRLTKKKAREDETVAQAVANFDPTSDSGKRIINLILNVKSAILIKSTLSRHTTLKNYIPLLDPALDYLIHDIGLLHLFDCGAVVTSNNHRSVPVYVKKMISPVSAKENLCLSKLLKKFSIEHSDYIATWWNISLPSTITLSEEVYDFLSTAPYTTFITVPITVWAPRTRLQEPPVIGLRQVNNHAEPVQSALPLVQPSTVSVHARSNIMPRNPMYSSGNNSMDTNENNSTDSNSEKNASVISTSIIDRQQQPIQTTTNDLDTHDENHIQKQNFQRTQKRSAPVETTNQSIPLLSTDKHYTTNIQQITSDSKMFAYLQPSTSSTTTEHLFNVSELVFIERVDKYFHALTPNKTKHIANICSNTFGRAIDEDMIRYTLSMFHNGFLPQFNLYCDVPNIVNTYAEQNKLYTLSNNVFSAICGKYCLQCRTTYSRLLSKRVTVYQFDGKIEDGLIRYYSCTHENSNKHEQPATEYYPNFIKSFHEKIITKELFNNTEYFYIGGDSIFAKKIFTQFETLLVTSHTNFQGFTEAYNLLHNYEQNDRRFAERRIFSQVWMIYQVINFAFFMGYEQISLPITMDRQQNDSFFYSIYDSLYTLFVRFWLNHSEHKPCSLNCSRALVVDGNQKLRRRICLDKSKTISTAEMSSINIGCDKTPVYKSLYCSEHLPQSQSRRNINDRHLTKNQIHATKAKNKLKIHKKHLRSERNFIQHELISCSTLKEMPNQYIDKCVRSFGIIVYVTNCNVTVAFNEIFRSETIKEILNGLISIVNISPTLPPAIIYDDACHLIRRLIDGQTKKEFKITPAIHYLNTKTYNIDRMHLQNHKDKWCRKFLDPQTNPLLVNVNTEACEQLFSWSNGYATSLTNMNQSRCRLMLLLTFHLRNCYLKKINPHLFDIGKEIVTKPRPILI